MIRSLKLRAVVLCLSLSAAALAADPALENEVRSLFSNGVWDRALVLLDKPASQTDPALRELLAMAYLYSAARIDQRANFEKAQTLMKQIVSSGGKARFFVSLGRDTKKEKNLLESTPGELIVSSTAVEFQPNPDTGQLVSRFDKASLSECAGNARYGTASHSFHLTTTQGRDRVETNFRPWHNSQEETNLICSLIGVQPAAQQGKGKNK
jgi:hypothetical protein